MQLIRDKRFYIALAMLALPIAMQDLIKFGLNLADNIMVGALSETELSAVTLANQPFFLFSMISFGLAAGGSVLISQYFGKQDYAAINKIISITLGITVSVSIIVGTAVLLFPEFFMRLFTPYDDIVAIGVEYLRVIGWTYYLYGISNTFVLILRSAQIVRPTLFINICAFLLNVFLNWALIFGKLGFPALGVQGAAIATLCARTLESVAIVLYVRFVDKKIRFRFKNMLHMSRTLARDFFKFSLPVVANEFLWGLGVTMISVVLGRYGESAVSAASIASSVQQVTSVVLLGVANASCVLIGKEIGAGNREYAIRESRTLLVLSVALGLLIGAALLLLREPILSLYNLDDTTRSMTMTIIAIAAGLVVVDSVGMTSIVGVMRGGGDTKFAMYTDVLTLWCFAVPAGLLLGLALHVPAELVYFAMRSDILIRCGICIARVKSNRWANDVTRPGATPE